MPGGAGAPWIVPLRSAGDPRRYGHKAAALSRALQRGLPVPAGVALAAGPIPDDAAAQLRAALARPEYELGGGPWVVRTSSVLEDGAQRSAAGLFLSRLGVPDERGLIDAVRACHAAAESAIVRAYLGDRAAEAGSPAVLIQRQVDATRAGVLFTRHPAHGPESPTMLAELARGSTAAVTAGLATPARYELAHPDETTASASPIPDLERLVRHAEAIAGGPADIELAIVRGALCVLQIRPITAYAPTGAAPRRPGSPIADEDGWRWDAEHNPDPLSPLQASLARWLDAALELPFRMRVRGGYLQVRPAAEPRADPEDGEDDDGRQPPDPTAALRELRRRTEAVEARARQDAPLAEVLQAYAAFYRQYCRDVGDALARGRRTLRAELVRAILSGSGAAAIRGAMPTSTPTGRAIRRLADAARADPDLTQALLRGELPAPDAPGADAVHAAWADAMGTIGSLAPVWDIAVPTWAEDPRPLLIAAGRLASAAPGEATPAEPSDPAATANVLALGELDDLYFARAQAALRETVLRRAHALHESGAISGPQAVFDWSIDELLAGRSRRPAASPTPRATARTSAPEADRRPLLLSGAPGGGGTAQAPALVIDDLRRTPASPAAGHVVVVSAALPSLLPVLVGAAGLITDHGGLLSHGAILARELGLPAVLGTGRATAVVAPGSRVTLDGDRGLVSVAPPGATRRGRK